MQLSGLFADDDAVSPVIGVILMVAITVILAAVIASFVLGLGSQPQQTPQTQFEFDFEDSDGNGDGILSISHNGGESLEPSEIEVRGDGMIDNTAIQGTEGTAVIEDSGTLFNWNADPDAPTQVTTGSTLTVAVDSSYDITVTYVPSEGGNTAPLADDQGPDA